MHGDRSADTLTESVFDREIKAALAVDPSPEFVARVHARIAIERVPVMTWNRLWAFVAAGAMAVVIVTAVVVSRSNQKPSPSADPALPPGGSHVVSGFNGDARSGPVRVGGDVKAPRKIVDVKPLYPDNARAAQAKGVVVLDVTIATDGSVSNARVLRSSSIFDQAAIDAVKQWKFEPTMLNSVPVEVEMNVFINFTLE